jgi:fibronectin-binding autotransporter adhesin
MGLVAIVTVAIFLPASASAAPCPVNPGNATSWVGGSGSFGDSGNWSNGTPTGSCDVSITAAGDYTVTMTSGANVRSLTLGGAGSTPHLVISDQSPNTNLDAQPAGITIAAGASVTLTCPAFGCLGGPAGGAGLVAGASPLLNAGTIKVDASSGTGAAVNGAIVNTGSMIFEKSATLGGKVTNQGLISIADGATVTNSGSSCGDSGAAVKNDAAGLIDGNTSGLLSVKTFEQGDGTTRDVTIPCGTLSYTGDGASDVRATGGFNLTGEMVVGQVLTISAEGNNTNAVLQSDFTNKGSITLTCPALGCSGSGGGPGGGAGFNANGHAFTNAGKFTFATGSGTDAGTSGSMTNTGTIQFDQSGFLGGVVTNKGTISIASGKVTTSPSESCGNPTPRVINDSGGFVKGLGTGTLKAVNFEQGAGTTSGSAPVTVDCGTLKYVGSGESTITVNTSATMTGNLAAGQVLRIAGQVNNGAFTNAGTIRGNGTVNGSVENLGLVAPGEGPGTLTVTGAYNQGPGGRLEIEVGGTGSGEHDVLAVAGNLGLGGTLALEPSGGFAGSAAIGDSASVLTYGGTVTGFFGQTTVNPELPCGKALSASLDPGAKVVAATVVSGNPCPSGGSGGGGSNQPPPPSPPPVPAPNTKIGAHPGAKVFTSKAKLKVKIAFSADLAGATFECKLDKGAFARCSSPKSYKVKPGKHTFSVRAIGPGGTDATPAKISFKVVRRKG